MKLLHNKRAMPKNNYYQDELKGVNTKSEFAPTVKITSPDGGKSTKHLGLNADSAKALIEWLTKNYINPAQ